MKLGILTFHWANNYGALLQTYSLCETLKKLGYEVEIINLCQKKERKNLRYYLLPKPFYKFRRNYLPVQKQIFYSSNDLRDSKFDHDFFIVGSDQVWNKEITKSQKYSYFFDFLPKNKKRISYAASFGLSEWIFTNEETNNIKELVNRFNAISIRENSGKNLLKKHLAVEATLVLDPTLLLGDFSNLISSKLKDSNEIVCFKFIEDKEFYNFGLKLATLENKNIRLLKNNRPVHGFKWSPFLSVPQLISHIKQSDLVVTDSFHITCLAIIFKKQIIVLPANPKRMGRISDLFKVLNLEDHLYQSYDEVFEKQNWKNKIDYDLVSSTLNLLRSESVNFIKSSLR
jgi:hypothetical protein